MTADTQSPESTDKLVVVGASAGGIEALSVLVSTLPADFPAPLVLAQHLDPRRRSNLEQILGRRTTLPIVVVQDDQPLPLQPRTIYVVPANRHVAIAATHVALEGDHGDRPRPSIDLLLTSAAHSYGENLIAVILTGSGTDGAAGAVEVSQAGGTVIIQNPETAQFPAMPLALPPTVVDHVVNLDRVGPLLYDLLTGAAAGELPDLSADPLRDILAHVSRQASLDFRQYKASTILRRIGRRMTATHSATLPDYLAYLDHHPEEVGELVMAFLIKVTEFFRDPAAFEYLRTHVLPVVLDRARANGRSLRFWSAGCATGEEPYSLAALVADMLGPDLADWSIKIFATDLDDHAITFARRGLYPPNVLANLPDDYRTRFFEPAEHGYRVSKLLRQLVIFGRQDLTRSAPFPRINLVVCRNVLIYFKPELQQDLLDTFAYSLAETGGYLFLGQAETVRPSKAAFDMVSKKWKIYRCMHAALNRPVRQPGELHIAVPRDIRLRTRRATGPEQGPVPARDAVAPGDLLEIRRFNELILRLVPTGVVVIDRSYHIVTINPAGRRLLSIRDLGPEQDFLHSARALPYNQVRAAIDTVFREHNTVTLSEVGLEVAGAAAGRFLTLTIVPMHVDTASPELAVVSITDVTEEMQTRQSLQQSQAEQRELVDELSEANHRLSELNKELQDANEELQASNEEMMLTQEELQASNEEFEATNEELQATNEELETNNEELQATNEELETTNEELAARTNELQELARNLATERLRLNEVVALAPFYIMVLRGPTLLVEAVNPRYAELLAGRESVGRPLDEISGTVDLTELAAVAQGAYRENRPRTTPRRSLTVPGPTGQPVERFFVYTVVPTHDSGGAVNGAVVYAEDVTRRVVREAEEWREQLQLMVEHAGQVAIGLYDARSHALLQASSRYLDILARAHNRPRDGVLGATWDALPLLPSADSAIFAEVVAGRAARRLAEVRLANGGDGAELIADLSLIPIAVGQDEGAEEVQFVVVSAVEVTAQVHTREALEQADQLKDEFLTLASHELRTPLVPLRGYSEMITRLLNHPQRSPDWEDRLRTYAGRFNSQIRYLGRLIDDLVDLSRLQSGKFTLHLAPVDLRSIVQQAADVCVLLDSGHSCAVQLAEPDTPVRVQGDAERLTQVVLNLVENAIKYAPDSPAIDLHLASADGTALLTVHDSGPGIPAEALPTLFDRFYQVPRADVGSRRGLGLGLYIARQIVEQHGGTIAVDSAPGQGSTFTICLPLLLEAPS